jgi:hypothetical protein
MGIYRDIRNEVKSILEPIQLGGSTAFTEVTTNPTNKFEGYPAASVMPARVDSEFITVAQNQRAYGITIFMYVAIDQEDWSTAIDNTIDLIDAVLDALDQSIDLNGKADFLRAVPMEFDTEETGQGLCLVSSIYAVAIKDVDVR